MNLKLKVIKHNIKQCAIVTSLNKKKLQFPYPTSIQTASKSE